MVENSIATKRYSLKGSKQGQQIIKLLNGNNDKVTDELIYSRCRYEKRSQYRRIRPMSEAEQTVRAFLSGSKGNLFATFFPLYFPDYIERLKTCQHAEFETISENAVTVLDSDTDSSDKSTIDFKELKKALQSVSLENAVEVAIINALNKHSSEWGNFVDFILDIPQYTYRNALIYENIIHEYMKKNSPQSKIRVSIEVHRQPHFNENRGIGLRILNFN
ncbi:MAG: hypothetical protein J1E97_04115 [Muribaculaceae bacterium]|nr:hypothetical protein [Muribaculaceae bacterium]